MVRRFDAGTLEARRDAAGMLRGQARLTRTGVLVYRNADGSTRRELRPEAEVFKAESLRSLSLAPMTLGHPKEAVTAKNARTVVVGTIGEAIRADGKFVRAPFVIHDDAAIAEVESGRMRELSCGYDCDLDFTPGTFEGERYDAVQRNIVYNHVAQVTQGRAGPEVRIDGADAFEIEEINNTPANIGNNNTPMRETRIDTMKTIKIDGIEYDVSSPAFDQAFAKYEQATATKIATLTTERDQAKKDADTAKGRADGLDSEIAKLKKDSEPAALEKRVNERVSLVENAKKILGKEFKTDGKTDDEIKRAVILKANPKAKLDGQSADYVNARFDAAIENVRVDETSPNSSAALRRDLAKLDAEDALDREDDLDDTPAQEAMKERNRNAWKGTPAAK